MKHLLESNIVNSTTWNDIFAIHTEIVRVFHFLELGGIGWRSSNDSFIDGCLLLL